LASEVIWRELDLASKEKPVIASMGEVAASGGYYIAAAADTISWHNQIQSQGQSGFLLFGLMPKDFLTTNSESLLMWSRPVSFLIFLPQPGKFLKWKKIHFPGSS
jgi:hypothetical protein